MAKPWVEGGYYEECSWSGVERIKREREKTKVKWLKKNIQERKEESHLHKWRKKGKIARWKNMGNKAK